MLTHRNLVANMEQLRALHRVDATDTLVGLLPFFHIYGQTVVINLGLSQGATIVTMPRFDMGAFLDLLETHRVTRAHVAPPVVLGLAKAPGIEGRELALRVVFSGAPRRSTRRPAKRAGERVGAPVRQGYGMTEARAIRTEPRSQHKHHQLPGDRHPRALTNACRRLWLANPHVDPVFGKRSRIGLVRSVKVELVVLPSLEAVECPPRRRTMSRSFRVMVDTLARIHRCSACQQPLAAWLPRGLPATFLAPAIPLPL